MTDPDAPPEQPDDGTPYPTEPARMDAAAIDTLARDVLTGRVWLAAGPPELDAFETVLRLASSGAAASGHNEEARLFFDRVGAVWEYIYEASAHSVNGAPSFLSAKYVHADDLEALAAAITAKQAALDATAPKPEAENRP